MSHAHEDPEVLLARMEGEESEEQIAILEQLLAQLTSDLHDAEG